MKKVTTILALLAVTAATASAAISTNFFPEGTFSPTPTTNVGNAGPYTQSFPTTGGNPDDYGRIDGTVGGGWGVIVIGDSAIPLSEVGLTAGIEYTFLWDMKTETNSSGVFGPDTGGIKIESWTTVNIGDTGDVGFTPISTNGTWDTYSYDYTVEPGATAIKLVPLVTDGAGNSGSICGFDNFRVLVPDSIPLNASISSPAEGEEVSTNGFYISASATVVPGTVTNVDFFANGSLVGSDTNVPYFVEAVGVPAGAAALTVVAKDSLGGSITSAVVNVTVVTNLVETLFTLDPKAGWGGWMNVNELDDAGFVFGSGWGVNDLVAEFSGFESNSILTLKPTFITLPAGSGANGFTNDTFWYIYGAGFPENASGAVGNKSMEANLLITVPTGTASGKTVRFTGTNITAGLLSGIATNGNDIGENSWTCEAFIKDLDADFSTNSGNASEIIIPITNGAVFDIALETYPDPSRQVQYGIRTRGPNVWPGDEDAAGYNLVFETLETPTPITNSVTVDPASDWVGFMNVFETPANGSGFVFGSGWGFNDLQAEFSCPDGLALRAAGIDDTNEFWYLAAPGGPGSTGNKTMEAVAHVADDSLVGSVVNFSGTVSSTSLLAAGNTNAAGDGWTGIAMIRDFAPDFSSFNTVTTPLTPGAFSIELVTDGDTNRHVQYGFIITGPNVWPTDVASFGDVVIASSAPVPASLAASLNGSNIDLSFCTQTGFSYQVEFVNDLGDAWAPLGSAVAGDGTTKTVSDPTSNPDRYYRLSVQ